ncbi:MAG: molybdenum cofactor guanylyltransferase [Methanobacteriaceae archaeon]|nr:molybdenum cofactor guanylyltransferase [Methanobacteriaceae archaeon]
MHSCIILCGGRSQRMGTDKGLISLDSKPLIIHIMQTLERLADEIILVFRDEKQLSLYEKHINHFKKHLKEDGLLIKMITDQEMDKGPLMGLFTGLTHVESYGALVLPCDSPFISSDFVKMIFKCVEDDKTNEYSAIVPQWPDGSVEPLHAYYHKKCLPLIKNRLKEGFNDVKSLYKVVKVNYVDVNLLDPEKTSFRNLNRPEDLNSS